MTAQQLQKMAEAVIAAKNNRDHDYAAVMSEKLHRELTPETILTLLAELEAAHKDADAAWALFPGTTYMDPPDGGSPTLAEMLGRMAKDAGRYRGLYAHTKIFEHYFVCEYEEIDAMVDAALNPAREDV